MAGTFEDFLAEQDQAQTVDRSAIRRATETSPDEAAEAQSLAPKVGLPLDVVQRNLPDVKKQQAQASLETFLKDTPELGSLSRDDQFLSVAHDTTEEMGALKQTAINLRSSVNRITGGLVTSLGDLMDKDLPDWMQVGFVRQENGSWKFAQGDEYKNNSFIRADVGMGIQESAARDQRPLAPWREVLDADTVGGKVTAGAAFAGEQVVLSVPEMLAAFYAPFALGTSYVGQIETNRANNRAAQTGGPAQINQEDRNIATLAAIPISLLNKFGADKVLGVVGALESSALRRTLTAGAAEGITEVTQDQIQYIAERAGIQPIDVHEMLANIPPTLLGAAAAGAGLHGGAEVIHSTVGALARRSQGAQEATQNGEMLDELTRIAETSKLRERSPEQFAKLVDKLAPNTELYVSALDLKDALNQSEIEALPQEMQDRIEEGAEADTAVKFTASEYATYLSAASKKLNPKVRIGSADAVNVEEAEKIQSEFKQRAEDAIAAAQDADALVAEGDQIRDSVQAQIVSTGRFRPDVAGAYASLIRDFFVTQSSRLGVSPAQLFAQYPIRVNATGIVNAESLDQPLNEAALAPVASLAGEAGELPRGFTRFRHFGNHEVPQLDPNYQGSGLRGAEARRGGPKVTSLYPDKGFTREPGTGDVEYVVDVPSSKLYDADADPQGFRAQASDFSSFDSEGNGVGEPTLDAAEFERLIQRAGFEGYTRPNAEGNLRGQARLFNAVPVKRAPVRKQVAGLEGLLAKGQQVLPGFTKFVHTLAKNVGAVPKVGKLKKADRAEQKVLADYDGDVSKLTDVVRGTIIVDNFQQVGQVVDAIQSKYKVLRLKDRFNGEPAIGGYRDVAVIFEFDGMPVELQVNFPEMMDAKAQGHKLYEERRTLASQGSGDAKTAQRIEELDRQQEQLYAAAWDVIRSRSNSSSEITSPSSSAVSSVNGLGAGLSNAITENPPASVGSTATGMPDTLKNTGTLPYRISSTSSQNVPHVSGLGPADGAYVNIGLATNDGTGITPEQIAQQLAALGVQIKRSTVQQSNTEATLVAQLSRPLTKAEGDALSAALGQEAIAAYGKGKGRLYGPMAKEWGPFNPSFFLRFDGKPLAESLDQQARGRITLGSDMAANPATITLLQNADLSTFLHESGHLFLEILTDIAARPGAPAAIVNDAQSIFNWLGFKGDAAAWRQQTISARRDMHEKFARGFESWLYEGKAPGPDQRRMFQRFRAWLVNIYQSLSQLNVTLTDEVRSVMSRMVATEEQVAAAEAQRSLTPLFTDQASSGMTPEEYQQYQATANDATQNAQDQLQTRSLRNVRWLANAKSKELRRLQKENASKREAIQKEVENELDQRPERVAENLLNTGEAYLVNPQGGEPVKIKLEGPHKLSTEKLARDFGDTAEYRAVAEDAGQANASEVRAPWHGLPKNFVAKDGLSADELADMVGITSGDQLVATLLSMAPRERMVQQMTDARVLQKYGDLNNEQELMRAVDIALHNQMRTRMVATELAALEGASNVRAGRRDLLRRAAREFAERVVNRKKVRDLRPGQFAAAEAHAARMAMDALAKGDSRLAAIRKRDQLFNGYANREASKAQENIEKGLRYLLTFQNEGTRKNLDPGYRDQIDKLLERFDLKTRSLKEIDKRTALANWIKEQEDEGNTPAIPPELVDESQRTHYRNLTVEQFGGLVDAVKNIEHLARLKNKLLANKRQRDFDAAKAELIASIEANGPPVKNVELERDVSAWSRAGDLVSEWLTSLRKLASLVRVMDGGKDGGRAWDYFVRPLNEAADAELLMRREATGKLNALLDMVPGLNPNAAQRAKRKLAGARKRFIPEIQRSLSLDARLAVALNAGNEGNLQRLMEGNGWTKAQVQAVINSLSKQEMDFVQATLDYIGSFWSQIRAKEERVTGVAPDAVEPIPIQTAHGVYKGGYYPIVADAMRSDKAAQQNDAELIAQSLRGSVTRATTRRGHTKERVGGKDPVRLDLGVIAQHISQVTHDLAWHETLIDFNKMLRDREVSATLRERYGPDVTRMMRRVVDDVARGEVGARTASERILNYLRTGSTIAGLGLNVVTSLMQVTGFTQSIVRVGHIPMYNAIARFTANPVKATTFAQEKSEFMRSRSLARNRELGEVFNRLDGKTRPLASIAFWPIQAMQTVVDVPTWHAAYNKALEAGETDDRAVALADQAVRDAQGSGVTHDLAEIQRSGPLLKLLTNFYSYFNTTYNLAVESAGNVRREKNFSSVLKMGADYLLLFTIPTVFTQLVVAAMRGDKDDDEAVVEKLVKGHVSSALNMFPIIREIGGAIEGYDYRGPAGLSFFSDASKLVKQASQGEVDEALLRAANRTAGQVLHYPATQVDRTVRGLVAVSEGNAGPQAILLGPPKE